MIRLLALEYYKLRNSTYFWVLSILFVLFLISVPIGVKSILDHLTRQGETLFGNTMKPEDLPFFDFVDIWQNLTWIYMKFTIFLGFIAVISICNEFRYGTIKQHIIDGLNRKEFLISKLSFIVVLSALATFLVFLIGLLMGWMWSPVKGVAFMFQKISFLGAYFLHLVAFQSFCLFVAILIKRSGLVIALLIFYIYVIESILAALLRFQWKLPWLADLLPGQAISRIIRMPFNKYLLRETQNTIAITDFLTLCIYLAFFIFSMHYFLTKRDLN